MLISVINDKGLRFNVRLVRKGERYGLVRNGVPCCVNEKDDPLVEFYDDRYKGPGFDSELGQFVTRYNWSDLLESRWGGGLEQLQARGLCLHGGVPEWDVDGVCMVMVFRAVENALK